APISRFQVRFATQDYGSGDGNPVGEKPQDQGKNPKSHLEHPGPDAPNVGGGKSSSASSSSSDSASASASSSPSPSNPQNDDIKTEGPGKKGAVPKILNESTPVEESDSTKRHNEEMNERNNKPNEQIGKK
ncbi:hypothetical protein K504DRAFT_350748, partial [Pleomassaria siparia CBS 279.74]